MTKEEAEQVLFQWGEWQKGAESLLLSKTNLLAKKGVPGRKFVQSVLPDMSEEVQFADVTICKMPLRTRKVLKAYYIFDMSQEQISTNYDGYSRNEVRVRLEAGANFLAGAIANAA